MGAFAIEEASYPEDEAATLEKLRYRQKVAGDFFLGLFVGEELVGFICSTLVHGALTEESMSIHEEKGETLCIHSVAVKESQRRKGFAKHMLNGYIEEVKRLNESREVKIQKIALICKEHLVGLYAGVGFNLIGASKICHGKDPWMDMDMTL